MIIIIIVVVIVNILCDLFLRPLDLATIKKNIESGVIRTTVEFQRDMMQMFTNAIMYNNSDHDVCHMATEMYDDVMKHIEVGPVSGCLYYIAGS